MGAGAVSGEDGDDAEIVLGSAAFGRPITQRMTRASAVRNVIVIVAFAAESSSFDRNHEDRCSSVLVRHSDTPTGPTPPTVSGATMSQTSQTSQTSQSFF